MLGEVERLTEPPLQQAMTAYKDNNAGVCYQKYLFTGENNWYENKYNRLPPISATFSH